jgi:hypothetical protein
MEQSEKAQVEALLDHQGEFSENEYRRDDRKGTWVLAKLLGDYFKSEKRKLSESQFQNLASFMARIHPVARLALWANFQTGHAIHILFGVHRFVEELLLNTALQGDNRSRDGRVPFKQIDSDEEIKELNEYMRLSPEGVPPPPVQWLREHGFTD